MTIAQFGLLSTSEQADYLSQFGKCHFSRMIGCYFVNEFLLASFTAEVWYDTSLRYVERITARPSLGLLDLKRTTQFASECVRFNCKQPVSN